MERRQLIIMAGMVVASLQLGLDGAAMPQNPPVFRGGVKLVRVGTVVRDRKGRFVPSLTAQDFEVVDDGKVQRISNFHSELSDVSVAVLLDVSGSMEGRLEHAREAANHLLASLDRADDEAAIFTFDTRLDEVTPFTTGLRTLPSHLDGLTPFGATSLHDAIARTAERLTARGGLRRAVVVFTDGIDTASRMKASQVSAIAASIDVPVYVVGIVRAIDNPSKDISTVPEGRAPLAGDLADLAAWTGGHSFMVSTPAERNVIARRILDELRRQYVISFESNGRPGWHPLVVRTRNKDHVVRARGGYSAGQSRPIS